MPMTPNELRKTPGCWACDNSSVCNNGNDPEITCTHPDESIRKDFRGEDTAISCKGFRMKPCDLLYGGGRGVR